MIHHDPILSGSVIGSDAVVSLSGSFTGSGTISNADTASRLIASASFGLGMEAFDFDGSVNQTIAIDTASAHFISGAMAASGNTTGSFLITASISGLTQSFTKGDGSTFELALPDTASVDLLYSMSNGLGIETFTFENVADAIVQVNTSSFHVANLTASLVTTASYSTGSLGGTPNTMSFTKGDGSTFDVFVENAVVSVTPSTVSTLQAVNYEDGTTVSSTIFSSSHADSADRVDKSLDQGLGIETFSYVGNTAGLIVQVDTSSAHFTVGVSQSQATTLTNLSASFSTSQTALSSSLAGGVGTASTASMASRVENVLSNGTLVDAFTYDGSATATVDITTFSASVSTARDLAALQVSGAFDAVSASFSTSQTALSSSLAASAGADISSLSASNAAALTALSASSATALTTESGSASTARDTAALQVSGAFENISASFSTSQTALSASANLARRNYYQSSSITPLREEDSFRLTKGDGTVDTIIFSTASFVKSVNTATPDAAGNVAVAIASVSTGLSGSNGANFPASPTEGDVYIISGETADAFTASNGKAFIYEDTSTAWFEISNLDTVENDIRYVQVSGDTMTGNLNLPADPTLAAQAARKAYVDLFYDSSSFLSSTSVLSLHKGDATIDTLDLSSISSTAISASYLSQANGVRIESTTAPDDNFITVNDGASNVNVNAANDIDLNMNTDGGAIGQVDFQNNGTSVANIDQDGTGSFAWVNATASVANRVRHDLTEAAANAGILPFTYDGNVAQTVAIDTGSAIFQAGVSASVADLFTGSTTFPDLTATGSVSGSFIGGFTGSLLGTASILPHSASQGVAILPFEFDGSEHAVVSVDTASQAFADGVAIGLSSASFAGLDINFSGSNLDFTLANLSGSTFDFSGSNLDFTDANLSGSVFDFSDAIFYANTASFSGSFNFNDAGIEGASFSGSSAFTGSFDFSNADVTGLTATVNYLPTTQSANFTAVSGRAYIVTQSSAVVTATLPVSPSNGDSIKLANMDDRATILGANGNKIMGLSEDMTLNVEQVSFELMYESTSMGWVIYGARAIT